MEKPTLELFSQMGPAPGPLSRKHHPPSLRWGQIIPALLRLASCVVNRRTLGNPMRRVSQQLAYHTVGKRDLYLHLEKNLWMMNSVHTGPGVPLSVSETRLAWGLRIRI